MTVRISKNRITLEGARLDQAILKYYGETLVGGASGTNTTASTALDVSSGNVFNYILAVATTTFTFTNPHSSGTTTSFTLVLKQDGSGGRAVIWPGAVVWAGGTAPTITSTANRFDVFTFFTVDGGTRWFGFVAGQDFT